MVLKFYGSPASPAGLRVQVILNELQIPFENIVVDFATAQHKSPEYVAKHPFGQVPYLDDDGFVIYESRAMARYLCYKYGGPGRQFIPTGVEALSLFEQMASVETSHFDPPASKIIGQAYYNPKYFGKPVDEAIVKENVERIGFVFSVYEKILSKQRYLAGDQITLVDFFHLSSGNILEIVDQLPLNDKPNVTRWWKEISSRTSWTSIKIRE